MSEIAPPRGPEPNRQSKRICLIGIGQLSREALCYAFNACQRLDARLDILSDLPPRQVDRLLADVRRQADVPWRAVPAGNDAADALCRYLQEHVGVLLLACAGDDTQARNVRSRLCAQGARLGVPWMVVDKKPDADAHPSAPSSKEPSQ